MTYKEAVKYLFTHQRGLISDIESELGLFVKEFELTGLIKRGQEQDRRSSYEITEEGKQAYEYVFFEENYQPTRLDKIQSAINRFI